MYPKNEYEFRMSVEKIEKRCPDSPRSGEADIYGFPVTVRYSPLSYLPAAAAHLDWAMRGTVTALEELYIGGSAP